MVKTKYSFIKNKIKKIKLLAKTTNDGLNKKMFLFFQDSRQAWPMRAARHSTLFPITPQSKCL